MLSGITMSREENILGRWILLSCLAMLLSMMGCSGVPYSKAHSRRAIVALMDSAEAVMNDDPGYALQLMDSINPASIPSRALNARYALIYSEVQYKNYIPAQSDSLIMIAVRYYSGSNQPELLFRTYYSLGCVYSEMGQFSDAAVALSEAEVLAEYVSDIFRLGLLYTQLGMVFSKSFDYHRADYYFNKAFDCYAKTGKDAYSVYALYKIAGNKMDMHDFGLGDSIMMIVEEWAHANGDDYLYSNSLISRFSCSLYLNKIDSASIMQDRYISAFGEFGKDPMSMGLLSLYYALKDDFENAQSFIDKAWDNDLLVTDSINLFYYGSVLAKEQGELDSALYYSQKYMALQNSNLGKVLRQSVVAAQRDHYQDLTQIEILKNRHSKVVLFAVIIISFLVVLLVFVYHFFHVKQIKLELDDTRSVIDELKRLDYLNTEKIGQLTIEITGKERELSASRSVLNVMNKERQTHSATIEQLQKEVFYQNRERFEVSDRLYSIYYDSGDNISAVRQQLAMMVNSLRDEYLKKDNLEKLDKIINESNNNVLERIRAAISLKEKELHIIRFSYAKLSFKAIGVIIDEKTDNVYQIKSRLLKRIKEYSEDLWLEIRNVL